MKRRSPIPSPDESSVKSNGSLLSLPATKITMSANAAHQSLRQKGLVLFMSSVTTVLSLMIFLQGNLSRSTNVSKDLSAAVALTSNDKTRVIFENHEGNNLNPALNLRSNAGALGAALDMTVPFIHIGEFSRLLIAKYHQR
jgi:hypothetical protein